MSSSLLIVASHPIQYQAPFFRLVAAQPDIDLTVTYCSRAGLDTYRDEDMKTSLRWDIDLIDGYRSVFLRNLGWGSGYARLLNPSIISTILRHRPDAVVFFTGWGTVSALMGILTCRMAGIPSFLYGDSSHPLPARGLRGRIRERFLRTVISSVTGFMVSGSLNADYYAHYGADRSLFFLLPWAVENERFSSVSPEEGRDVRELFGIPSDQRVIIFSAKLVARKDPLTLLRAVAGMHHRDETTVLFLGDGELHLQLEQYARVSRVKALFAGFVNQSALPAHYAAGDVFVLPSTYEPRGAVINEAMAAGLPVVVTDRCGSIGDIVLAGENAFIYPAGDAEALGAILDQLVSDALLRKRMASRSREIIAGWNYERGMAGVQSMLRWVANGARA